MSLLELAHSIGLSPKKVAYTHGGEYHSSCPRCGGTDRFYIQPERQKKNCVGYYACRQCGIHGDTLQFCMDFFGLTFKEAATRIGVTLPELQACSNPPQAPAGLAGVVLDAHSLSFRPASRNLLNENSSVQSITKPPHVWTEKANAFVTWAHEHLVQNPEALQLLTARGISMSTIVAYKLGYCPEDLTRSRTAWGLGTDVDNNLYERPLWLPKGIVIPALEPNGDVVRIKVRRTDWVTGDRMPKYIAISGSMSGLNIIGDTNHRVMIIVESELDGYALHSAVGDVAFCIAVGSNVRPPDNVTDYCAQRASKLLVCYDNDDAGLKMLEKWQQRYAHATAYPTPMGKDIGDAVALGLDVRKWIMEGIE